MRRAARLLPVLLGAGLLAGCGGPAFTPEAPHLPTPSATTPSATRPPTVSPPGSSPSALPPQVRDGRPAAP